MSAASPLYPARMPARSDRRTAELGCGRQSSRSARGHSHPARTILDVRSNSLRSNFSISMCIYKSAYLSRDPLYETPVYSRVSPFVKQKIYTPSILLVMIPRSCPG